MSQKFVPHPGKISPEGCISLIGMAAAGKTTIGRELSQLIDWPQMDADHLIEATYGGELQQIANLLSKEAFLDLEARIICSIKVQHTIISTGGSVVYRAKSMVHLAKLGPIIYIDAPLDTILKRIARKPDRGLAIAPGQTIEDLFNERKQLYEASTTLRILGGDEPPSLYAHKAVELLQEKGLVQTKS